MTLSSKTLTSLETFLHSFSELRTAIADESNVTDGVLTLDQALDLIPQHLLTNTTISHHVGKDSIKASFHIHGE